MKAVINQKPGTDSLESVSITLTESEYFQQMEFAGRITEIEQDNDMLRFQHDCNWRLASIANNPKDEEERKWAIRSLTIINEVIATMKVGKQLNEKLDTTLTEIFNQTINLKPNTQQEPAQVE